MAKPRHRCTPGHALKGCSGLRCLSGEDVTLAFTPPSKIAPMKNTLITWPQFDRYGSVGALLLRLFIAFVLIYGTQDNVFSHARMAEFRGFLAQQGFPAAQGCAYLSVYAQFIAGFLIAAGLATRPAAMAMAVNFLVALLMVHTRLPFSANVAPLAMLAGSLFLLFHGAGPWSVDARLRKA